jgi:hypothetical protein
VSVDYEELRQLIANTLAETQPENPDRTTRWARDFEDEEELIDWLRRWGVSQGSLERAVEEYGICRRTGTPKRFEICGKRHRGRYVKVYGRRKRSRGSGNAVGEQCG